MKKNWVFILFILCATLISSCKKDTPIDTPKKDTPKINTVTQFVYDGLSLYYYWADEVAAQKPTAADSDPKKYFDKVLNTTDKQHGWSWIADDVDALLAGFSGKSLSFGYSLGFSIIDNKPYAYIKYVFPNSPAGKAGLQRLDFIGKLNDVDITTVNRNGGTYISDRDYNLLFGNNAVKFTTYKLINNKMVQDKEITITPDDSAKDPVLYSHIYTVGGKKVGYLFYTNFVDDFNASLFNVFSQFKQEGVTDLVLDLRYNTGGAVSSAIYLASMIAPRAVVEAKSPFIVMDYNRELNNYFDTKKIDRKDYLGTYNTKAESNPLDANLNLNKVYIIATGGSYSASELITYCLRSYMDVVHIGNKTGGKYTASWTIHAYDTSKGATVYGTSELTDAQKAELKNWAMQPIVAMYANKDSKSFSSPGYLAPNYDLKEGFGFIDYFKPLGDTKDVFLGQALYLITGDASYQPIQPKSTRSTTLIIEDVNEKAIPVIDNRKLSPEDFRNIRELRRR